MRLVRQLMLTIIFASVMAFVWVSAEYVIDGVVHSSTVDDIVCGLFAAVLASNAERIIWWD